MCAREVATGAEEGEITEMKFEHMNDAFESLRDIAEWAAGKGDEHTARELRLWAEGLADLLGERESLGAAWPVEGDNT